MAATSSFFSSWYQDDDAMAPAKLTWDHVLAHEEKCVLYKLAQLADGQIRNYEGNSGKRKPGSTPPPDRISLYAYHEQEMAKARSKWPDGSVPEHRKARMIVIWEAEKDYWTAVKRPPVYNTEGDSDENKRQRDEAIIRWKGQKPAQWVAVMEGCSVAHVYRLWKARKEKNATPQA